MGQDEIKEDYKLFNHDEIKKTTLKIIYELLKDDLVKAYDYDYGCSEIEWNLTPEKAIERIRNEWGQLDNEPSIR